MGQIEILRLQETIERRNGDKLAKLDEQIELIKSMQPSEVRVTRKEKMKRRGATI